MSAVDGAGLFFQAICERYEKQQTIVLTSNKAFTRWNQAFAGDAIMAFAALDRLLHRSQIGTRVDRMLWR